MSKNYIIPPALRKGDALGIASIAGHIAKRKLRKGLTVLRKRGYKLETAKNLYSQHGYFAGEDAKRLGELNRLIRAKHLRSILFSRGGYGTMRLLDGIDYAALKRRPKILAGFSDLTALFSAVFKNTGLICYYSPVVANLARLDGESKRRFFLALEKKIFPPIKFSASRVIKHGRANGKLIGGCLSLLSNLIGTKYDFDWRNKILFFEDVDEAPYSVDRMLTQLKLADKLDNLRAVLIGVMKPKPYKRPSLTFKQVYSEIFKNYSYPVIYNLPFGHGARKYTLPIGGRASADTRKGIINIEI